MDFLAPAVPLIIEVDGGYHDGRRKADARRERWLRRNGIACCAFWLVLGNLESALASIRVPNSEGMQATVANALI